MNIKYSEKKKLISIYFPYTLTCYYIKPLQKYKRYKKINTISFVKVMTGRKIEKIIISLCELLEIVKLFYKKKMMEQDSSLIVHTVF